ncbi:hypothetical protein EVA_20412, partial [gut metagenome]
GLTLPIYREQSQLSPIFKFSIRHFTKSVNPEKGPDGVLAEAQNNKTGRIMV